MKIRVAGYTKFRSLLNGKDPVILEIENGTIKDEFFEGSDFEGTEFKALMPKYYPPKYQEYIREETELLKSRVKGSNRILEAGVGIGRLIPELAPLVKEFVGIDNADLMIKKSAI